MDTIMDAFSAGKDAFTLSQFGSSEMPPFQPVRTINIEPSMSGTKFSVVDSSTSRQLYKLKMNMLGNITLITEPDEMECARTKAHSLSSTIDIEVRGQQMQLKKSGASRGAQEWQSPQTGGKRIWKDSGTGDGLDIVCIDDRGTALALYHVKSGLMGDYGVLELAEPVAGGPLLEEVLVTGTTVAHTRIAKLVHAVT